MKEWRKIMKEANTEKKVMNKVLFMEDGMDDDCFMVLTDAPRNVLEDWYENYLSELEDGINNFLKPLQEKYYVQVLIDSTLDAYDWISIAENERSYDYAICA